MGSRRRVSRFPGSEEAKRLRHLCFSSKEQGALRKSFQLRHEVITELSVTSVKPFFLNLATMSFFGLLTCPHFEQDSGPIRLREQGTNGHRAKNIDLVGHILSSKHPEWTSLVVWWTGICLRMQGTWVPSLVGEGSTCHRETKSTHHTIEPVCCSY